MSRAARAVVALWVIGLAACAFFVSRAEIRADLAAFLPRTPSAAQQVLVEQLSDGMVSRLVLVGIEGAEAEQLAAASRRLAALLRERDTFVSINNGEDTGFSKDRDFLWRNRYLLSDAVTPERFTEQGLHASLEESLQRLGSPAGMLIRRMLPADPGGEALRLFEQLAGNAQPEVREGVWFSPEGKRALLVAQTRAAGSDIDGQQRALGAIRDAFSSQSGESGEARLLLSGPGVFAVMSRQRIESDAKRLSLIATLLIAAMLLALYRSPRVLGLGLLPVASGALAGIAAVSLGFGSVHGITLGFGVTLIGEGVDYAIYLFTQIAPGAAAQPTFERIWPTLRLGVLTSICGFSAMLFSGFTGLAQLGLFSIVGLIVAAAVTRWVLPALLPRGFTVSGVARLAPKIMHLVTRASGLRNGVLLLVALAVAVLALLREPLWSDDLASLSPVSHADQRLDAELRRDLGAPDIRHLVVIHARDEQAALQASERVAASLQEAIRQGWMEGFEAPSLTLPSEHAQRARQAALPSADLLRDHLTRALRGLPFQPGLFEPFLKDVAAARAAPLLARDSLAGTHLALKLDSLLVRRPSGWAAMLPLRGVSQPERLAQTIATAGHSAAGDSPGGISAKSTSAAGQIVVLDLKRESEQLYRGYRREALTHSLLGAAAIVVLLFASLRSARRVFDVLAPLAAAVLVTTAVLAALVGKLSIFHLVGLLLVVAVGSNYALFFDRHMPSGEERQRTMISLLFANLSTVIGFGLLSFSSTPVLQAIGTTVGMGAILSLAFSAAMNRHAGNGTSGNKAQ